MTTLQVNGRFGSFPTMKKLLVVVVLFLGIAVVALSFSEFETIALTLQKAHLTFFLLAILVQMIWFIEQDCGGGKFY